ncbi:hypothetical protein [Spiroplasma clarkii]|nr:hypothetical protein [Spiroplasma clarkii]
MVVGNPARVVKIRFDQATIAKLEALQWWELPLAEIKMLLLDLLKNKL